MISQSKAKTQQPASRKYDTLLPMLPAVPRNVLHYVLNLNTNKYDYIGTSSISIIGFTPSELKSLTIAGFIARIHPEDIKQLNTDFDCRRLGRNITPHVEYRFLHRNGSYRWMLDNRSISYDASGRPIALIGRIRDITHEKNIQKHLLRISGTLNSD